MTVPGFRLPVSGLEFRVFDGVTKREPCSFVIEKDKKAEIRVSLSDGDAKLKIILEENASLEMKSEIRNSSSLMVDCMLSGAGSSVSITNICNCEKSDMQKSVTNVIHSAPKTRSTVNSKGVAWGSSSIELSGLAKIEKSAPGSFSRVECKALVLGEKAKARADPILEILNNDVDCSHAASVREIEKEKVFYLQTRGLNEEEAKKMIVEGFLGESS
jgi:Fe-S cluster assembly protein SufB